MLYLLLCIALAGSLFTAVLEKEDSFRETIRSRYTIHGLSFIPAVIVFIMYYKYPDNLVLLIPAGVVLIVLSFIYLNVLPVRNSFNHFSVHLIMVSILSALIPMHWVPLVYFPLIFTGMYFAFSLLSKKLWPSSSALSENMKQVFELNRILNGILLLVIGLALATDGIRFFWRIGQYLFD